LFYTRKPDILKRGLSLVAEYLKTDKDDIVKNQMDYGFQLGRKFRSLKLWFVIHYFGVEGLQRIIRKHFETADIFKNLIMENENFELLAPVTFSTICFRAKPAGIEEDKLNELNLRLMTEVNNTGKIFISHTVLNKIYTLRLVVSGIRTETEHVKLAYKLFVEKLGLLLSE
jgi:aromatic-L-amino-acid decarboxylase